MSKQNLARRQVRAALHSIDELIPVPWDLELLVGRIAEQRGRPIRLLPTEFPAGDVSGLWMPIAGVPGGSAATRRSRPPSAGLPDRGVRARPRYGSFRWRQSADLICYDREASPAVREQTIGHELGHLLMNHLEDRRTGPSVADQLASVEISPALIERFLARTAYETVIEAAAEEFGTRLLQAGHRRRGADGSDALGRLTGSLR